MTRSSWKARIENWKETPSALDATLQAAGGFVCIGAASASSGATRTDAAMEEAFGDTSEHLKMLRIMRAANVNQQLARAALNWNNGQEDKAMVNLEADINSIMLENRVTRAQAVDALTGALSADISHVMNSCGVSYALASAAMEWSLGGVEETVLNLNADIEAIIHENSERWQFASETISRAQAIRALEGALSSEMAHAMMSSGVSYEAASAALNWTPAGSDVDYIASADETQPLQPLPRHEEIQVKRTCQISSVLKNRQTESTLVKAKPSFL